MSIFDALNFTAIIVAITALGLFFILYVSYHSQSETEAVKRKITAGRDKINARGKKKNEKFKHLLKRADISWGIWEYRFYCIAIAVGTFYILDSSLNRFIAVIFSLLSLKALKFYLNVRAKKRREILQSQFNNALEYIKNEYASLLNDKEALQKSYGYFKDPLKKEFKPVIQAIDIGADYVPALKQFNESWGLKRMHMFIGVITSINRHGSSKGLILMQGLINQATNEEKIIQEFKAKAYTYVLGLGIILGVIPASILGLKVFTPSMFEYYTNNILGQIALSFIAIVELALMTLTYIYVSKEQ